LSLLVTISVNRVPIRLAPRRWAQLGVYYDEILDTVARPDYVFMDSWGDLVAVRDLGGTRCLQVTYREVSREEGYIISSSYATKWVGPGRVVWRRVL
jgi:hypothetical protein